MDDLLTAIPQIKIDGAALAESALDRISRVSVDLDVGTVGVAQLHLVEAEEHPSDPFRVGRSLRIGVVDDEMELSVLFDGPITGLGIVRDHRGTTLVVDAMDESVKLGRVSVNTAHLKTSIHNVISGLASDAGLSVDIDSSLSSLKQEFLQQTGTPHAVLDALAHKYGCEWAVSGGTLHVGPRKAGAGRPIKLEEPREFQARYSAVEEAASVTVRGWDPERKESIVSKVDSSKGALRKSKVPVAKNNRGKLSPNGAVSYVHSPSSQKDADALADASLRRLESTVITGRGEVDVNGAIKPMSTVDISQVAPDWDGKYYVTGVQHVFGAGQPYVTRFKFGSLEPTNLVDLLGKTRKSSTDVVSGSVTIGIVDSVQDERGEGRVRVKLPFITEETTSTWARVVQQGAGPKRGWVLLPEVDDEVVVAFENGDLDRPLVVGGLWNGKDKIPIAKMGDSGAITSRTFTSRVGHTMTFFDGDKPAERYVSIVLADGKTKLRLGEDEIELSSESLPISVTNGDASIDLAKNGDLKLAAKNIVLDSKGKIELKASTGITVKANGSASFEGATTEVKGTKVSVNGSGMTEIKGGMVKVN